MFREIWNGMFSKLTSIQKKKKCVWKSHEKCFTIRPPLLSVTFREIIPYKVKKKLSEIPKVREDSSTIKIRQINQTQGQASIWLKSQGDLDLALQLCLVFKFYQNANLKCEEKKSTIRQSCDAFIPVSSLTRVGFLGRPFFPACSLLKDVS